MTDDDRPPTTVTLDTETTHLDPRIGVMWEAAFIVEDHPDPLVNGEWSFVIPTVPITDADPTALAVGRFMERTTAARATTGDYFMRGDVILTAVGDAAMADLRERMARNREPDLDYAVVWTHGQFARWIARALENATIVGIRPEFDLPFLANYVREHHGPMSPYYHTIDVCQVTLGMIPGPVPRRYSSGRLTDLAGLDVAQPAPEDRHTALGDARWARRWLAALDGQTWEPTP